MALPILLNIAASSWTLSVGIGLLGQISVHAEAGLVALHAERLHDLRTSAGDEAQRLLGQSKSLETRGLARVRFPDPPQMLGHRPTNS